MDAGGHTSSDSVVLVSLETGGQAHRFIVESVLRADPGTCVGGLREILTELAGGCDLAGSSDYVETEAIDAAGTGSG